MTQSVRLLVGRMVSWSVGRLVGWLVGRSVYHNFLKGREVTLQCSYRITCLKSIELHLNLETLSAYTELVSPMGKGIGKGGQFGNQSERLLMDIWISGHLPSPSDSRISSFPFSNWEYQPSSRVW